MRKILIYGSEIIFLTSIKQPIFYFHYLLFFTKNVASLLLHFFHSAPMFSNRELVAIAVFVLSYSFHLGLGCFLA